MALTAIMLDNNENFISYLDTSRIFIEETMSANEVAYIDTEYYLDENEDVKSLFRLGNKIWIQGSSSIRDCLYILNTSVAEDVDLNYVSITAEDVLVELNNAPLVTQAEITDSNGNALNGYDVRTINGEESVKCDYTALNNWFGDYFDIGIVQDCVSEHLSRIVITGSMTRMELLRMIEEETGNVFSTRYEKDTYTNEIHRYLDFLNPKKPNNNWTFRYEYTYPSPVDVPSEESAVGEYDSDEDEIDDSENIANDNIVIIENEPVITPSSTQIQILDDNGGLVAEWNASDLGLTGSENFVTFLLSHTFNQVTKQYRASCQINTKSFRVTSTSSPTVTSQSGLLSDETVTSVAGTAEYIDSEKQLLPNHSIIQIVDTDTQEIYFKHELNPCLSDIHTDVLQLNRNVENIDYEIDETDTFNAVAPRLTASTDEYTRAQLRTIVQNWTNLSVTKGAQIPMIVQKRTYNGSSHTSSVAGNYWSRCLNNSATDGNYDYWNGTAYWYAPFNKKAGVTYIEDDTVTDMEYSDIQLKPRRGRGELLPKIDAIDCSAENVYEIYNAVAMHLKGCRQPNIVVDVDVANLRDSKYNDYSIHDRVYVKIPNNPTLVTATVEKTVKNAHTIAENKVTLSNYSLNSKAVPAETFIEGKGVNYTYPSKATMSFKLQDENDAVLQGRLITLLVYEKTDGSETIKSVYNVKTNAQGIATLTTQYPPGVYTVEASYGGEDLYEPTASNFKFTVGGTITQPKTPKTKTAKKKKNKTQKTKKKTVKRYWNKYGLSPNNHKYICAIGKPSAAGERDKYGYKFYKTVFHNKCPACGRASLYWGIYWAGNEHSNWGTFPATGNREGGSVEGHIFCKHCDADYSVFGKSHDSYNRKLKVYKKPVKSSKTEAYKLKKGQLVYDTVTKTVKSKKNTQKKAYTPKRRGIHKSIKQIAVEVADGKTGIAAAKKIARWCGANIKYEWKENFYQSPKTTLKRRRGNCCCQTDLMLEMMDAAGVSKKYKLKYIHVNNGKDGHIFAKVGNTYVDPCVSRHPWGRYLHGYGRIGSRPSYTYPNKPPF